MKKEYIVYKLSECAKQACRIDNELFTKYNVKRGLRNEDGTGVLVGLTKIGNVVGYERTDQGLKAIPGKLFYRGYDLDDIAHALLREKRFGFEEGSLYSLKSFQQKANDFKRGYFENKMPFDSELNCHRPVTEEDVEREFWRLVADLEETVEVEYGADIHCTTHGSGYAYDTHVPVIFYGWGIAKGSSVDYQRIIDIAPTIAVLLNIKFPSGCTGQPVAKALK